MSQRTPTPHQQSLQQSEPTNMSNHEHTNNHPPYATVHPPWKITDKLPTLTKNTLDTWLCSLHLTLEQRDLTMLSDPNFSLDNYSGEQKNFYRKASSSCAAAILASLDPTVSQLIPATTFRNTPNNIIAQLLTTLTTDNAPTHKPLESEAKQLKIDEDHTIHQFVDSHRAVRAKMIASHYPRIEDERTTVRLVLDGLLDNPKYSGLVRSAKFAGTYTTINQLHHGLQEVDEFDSKHNRPARQPAGWNHPPGSTTHQHRRSRGRGRGRFGAQSPSFPRHQYRHHNSISMDQLTSLSKLLGTIQQQRKEDLPNRRRPYPRRSMPGGYP